jgi:drug/metabolite transporter (DMT)-like permease
MTHLSNRQLFVLAVLIWGTTWHAILYQLDGSPPEFAVALRFGLAGGLVMAVCLWRGQALAVNLRAHARLALQGVFMYSLSYLCVYHAEKHVPSGLVAVGYSASPLLAGLGAWALWRTRLTSQFLAGGGLGVLGVALIFWPELAATSARPSAGLGLLFTLSAVLLSAVGALAASRNVQHGVPFWPAMGWALLYGALCSAVVLVWQQQPVVWPRALSWWLSLVYLAVAGTVLAFGAFLTLQQRVGPGKASTIGVMTPVVALIVSTALEGWQPQWWTLAGVLLAVAGNRLMLQKDVSPAAE